MSDYSEDDFAGSESYGFSTSPEGSKGTAGDIATDVFSGRATGGLDRDESVSRQIATATRAATGVPMGNILDPDLLNKEIAQFKTGRPALTREELLGMVNISPYREDAVNFEQMRNGVVGLPSEGLNAIRMEMGFPPSDLKGTGETPYDRKDFFTRASEKLADKFDFNDDEERVAIISGGNVPKSEGTYTVTSENTIEDFLANTINPLSGLVRADSRTMVPMAGGEKTQLAMISTPFGTRTTVTPYSQLTYDEPEDGGDASAYIPPRTGAPTQRTQSLVPMGTDRYGAAAPAAGFALNPSMYYTNPFSYSLPALGKSFGLLSF